MRVPPIFQSILPTGERRDENPDLHDVEMRVRLTEAMPLLSEPLLSVKDSNPPRSPECSYKSSSARLIAYQPPHLSEWPIHGMEKRKRATNGVIAREELRPDIFGPLSPTHGNTSPQGPERESA
jgi:hypothetical protein